MKTAFLATLALAAGVIDAQAADRRAQLLPQLVNRTSIGLFAAGQAPAAVAHLRAHARPEPGPDGAALALAQSLIEVAGVLYNQRRLDLARAALAEALQISAPFLAGSSAASAPRRAALLSSLGLLCEEVAFDFAQAARLYDAAVSLDPKQRQHVQRKRDLTAKRASVPAADAR